MKKQAWSIYVVWIFFTEAIGALSGWLTRNGVEAYQNTIVQPALAPPSIVFPIVWSILYALMGIGVARIYMATPSDERSKSLILFFVQLAINFFWSIIFFQLQNFGFAVLWTILLWIAILWMILSFRKVDPIAAWLQLPYLLWVTFAAYLTFQVWKLNS